MNNPPAKPKRLTHSQEMALDILAYPDRFLKVLGDPARMVFWDGTSNRLHLRTFRALAKGGYIRRLRIDVDHRRDKRFDIWGITNAGREALRD